MALALLLFSMYWQSNHFHSLLIEDWGGEYTVFQPESGKTHFLNQMSIELLSFLSQRSATVLDICHYLSTAFEQEADQDFRDNIEKILHHFDALGLIQKEK